MATIDLTTPPPRAEHVLDALPRRATLTLPELRVVAEHAGGAPLPFETGAPAHPAAPDQPGANRLEGRLGAGGTSDEAAYAQAAASLHDPVRSLRHRGLLTESGVEPGLCGAVGLLAVPELALEIDVATASGHVKAWHRESGGAVATLATTDGLVFEIAWFGADRWAQELARVTVPPEDLPLGDSAVPAVLSTPYSLLDSVGEALRASRADLVPVLVGQRPGAVLASAAAGAEEEVLDASAASRAVAALHQEAQGRLRVLAARIDDSGSTAVGVISWVLLADGWHALLPRHSQDDPRVEVRRVDPGELAATLAPVLDEVRR